MAKAAGFVVPHLQPRIPGVTGGTPDTGMSPPPASAPPPAIVQDSDAACLAKLQDFITANTSAHPEWFPPMMQTSNPSGYMSADGYVVTPAGALNSEGLLTISGKSAFITANRSCRDWVLNGMPGPVPSTPPAPVTPVTPVTVPPSQIVSAAHQNAVVAYWQSMPTAAKYTIIGITGALLGIGVLKLVDHLSEAKPEPAKKKA